MCTMNSCELVQAGSRTALGEQEASAASRMKKKISPGRGGSRSRGGHSRGREKQEQSLEGIKSRKQTVKFCGVYLGRDR